MRALTLRLGNNKNVINGKNKDRRWLVIPFILTAIPVCYFVLKNSQNQVQVQAQPEISPVTMVAAEKSNPGEFITGQVKMRRNFFNEIIIEGSLRNIARQTTYKDPVLRIDFLSKTGTVLFTSDYKIPGVLHPNGYKDYKFKNAASTDVQRISGRILDVEVGE